MFPIFKGGKSGAFLAGTKSRNKTSDPLEYCHKQPHNKRCKFTAFVQIQMREGGCMRHPETFLNSITT